MDLILNWLLRGVYAALGVGAGLWILHWLQRAWRHGGERWPLRIAAGTCLLVVVYGFGHARLLAHREEIEAARARYTRYGDPRLAEARRAEVRGWIFDCTGKPDDALARYASQDGVVRRSYPLGVAGENLIGGGNDAVARDFTVERLFTDRLRRPENLLEAGQLHPAGTDLALTLCRTPTEEAWELLKQSGKKGAVVVEDVRTGAILAYAATGGPTDAPFGIKRYEAPGSVFKLALSALWWDHDLPDHLPIPCPARIQVSPRASIGNYHGEHFDHVDGPVGMLVPSCNTAAIWMAQYMRDRLGEQAFIDAYRRYGFVPYPSADETPRDTAVSDFWATKNPEWAERMSPPPDRLRISSKTIAHEWALLSIGQGPVDVTVVGITRFIQAIGNGGVMLRPTIEAEVVRERGRGEGERIMKESTARKLQAAMREVARSGTAASASRVLEGLDWTMGGKTGTPEFPGRPDDGWFAGLAFDPDGQPRYAIAVYLQSGGPGGRLPAGIAAQMTRVLAKGRPAPVPLREIGEAEQ
jgi:cell division protein FtsI/penicillin-binding protein 2